MRKLLIACLGTLGILAAGESLAQLPASPWDTADFDAAMSSSGGVARVRRNQERRVNIPSIKYKAINADAEAPVFVPAIDSAGNAKTGVTVKTINNNPNAKRNLLRASRSPNKVPEGDSDAWRGSGSFGKLDYTGEVTTYGTAYGQEMLAPEVNNHNMNVMVQHLRNLGYKIPESYDNKFQNFLSDYSDDLRRAYNGLGHQNNPFDTMFSGFLDVVEDQSGLDMENVLFNSIDLISRD